MPIWAQTLLTALARLVERLAPYFAGYGMGSLQEVAKQYRKAADEAKIARQIENDVAAADVADVKRMLDKFKR